MVEIAMLSNTNKYNVPINLKSPHEEGILEQEIDVNKRPESADIEAGGNGMDSSGSSYQGIKERGNTKKDVADAFSAAEKSAINQIMNTVDNKYKNGSLFHKFGNFFTATSILLGVALTYAASDEEPWVPISTGTSAGLVIASGYFANRCFTRFTTYKDADTVTRDLLNPTGDLGDEYKKIFKENLEKHLCYIFQEIELRFPQKLINKGEAYSLLSVPLKREEGAAGPGIDYKKYKEIAMNFIDKKAFAEKKIYIKGEIKKVRPSLDEKDLDRSAEELALQGIIPSSKALQYLLPLYDFMKEVNSAFTLIPSCKSKIMRKTGSIAYKISFNEGNEHLEPNTMVTESFAVTYFAELAVKAATKEGKGAARKKKLQNIGKEDYPKLSIALV